MYLSQKLRVEATLWRCLWIHQLFLKKLMPLLYGFDCSNLCDQVTVSEKTLTSLACIYGLKKGTGSSLGGEGYILSEATPLGGYCWADKFQEASLRYYDDLEQLKPPSLPLQASLCLGDCNRKCFLLYSQIAVAMPFDWISIESLLIITMSTWQTTVSYHYRVKFQSVNASWHPSVFLANGARAGGANDALCSSGTAWPSRISRRKLRRSWYCSEDDGQNAAEEK